MRLKILFLILPLFCGAAIANRPVRLASIAFLPPLPLEEIVTLVSQQAEMGTDLILLPETFMGNHPEVAGETITALSKVAAKYKTYILCPLDRLDGNVRVNSGILLDRNGSVLSPIYDKKFPFWTEFDLLPPIMPGSGPPPIYDLDFGRVGVAICFDLNFPTLWKTFFDEKVEMVLWPSAYSGGALLRSYALQYHFYIVTCTQIPDCSVIDIDGSEMFFEKRGSLSLSRFELDLDRCIFHYDFNEELTNKLAPLLQDYEGLLERRLEREKWFILKTKNPQESARKLAKSYGLEELPDYIRRIEKEILGK